MDFISNFAQRLVRHASDAAHAASRFARIPALGAAVLLFGCQSGGDSGAIGAAPVSEEEHRLICGQSDFFQAGCGTPLWPNGEIFYRFDNGGVSAWTENDRTLVRTYMQRWQSKTAGIVRFTESTSASAVRIRKSVGGGQFPLGYKPGEIGTLIPTSEWNATHELGHLIGLPHAMTRSDRDRYIAVNPAYCPPVNNESYGNFMGRCAQDRIIRKSDGGYVGSRSDYGPFDILSLMEYFGGCTQGTCDASFQGCTAGECVIIKRGGGVIPDPVAPYIKDSDASAVAEMYAEELNWSRFRPVPSSDPGPTQRLQYNLSATAFALGSPAIVRYGEDTIGFARGTNGFLYLKYDVPKTGGWHRDLMQLDGLTSDPAATARSGRLDVAVNRSFEMVHMTHTPEGGWSSSLVGAPAGVGTLSAPAITKCGPDQTVVFVIRDKKLYRRKVLPSLGNWTSVSDPILRGKPAAASWGGNRIDVVAINDSSGLPWHFGTDDCGGSWEQPFEMAPRARAGTSPALAARTSGRLSMFVTGTSGVLYERRFGASGWEDPKNIGGLLENSSPSAFGASGAIHVFATIRELTPANSGVMGFWYRTWASCPTADENGDDEFCSSLCPCNEGQSDCDDELTGRDCVGNLVCAPNVGARYGYASNYDVCVDPKCLVPNGMATCHVDCPCGTGGACTQDEHCVTGLKCTSGQCAPL